MATLLSLIIQRTSRPKGSELHRRKRAIGGVRLVEEAAKFCYVTGGIYIDERRLDLFIPSAAVLPFEPDGVSLPVEIILKRDMNSFGLEWSRKIPRKKKYCCHVELRELQVVIKVQFPVFGAVVSQTFTKLPE